MIKINDRVRITKKDSPIFGKEFIVKHINEDKNTADLMDYMAQEITYSLQDIEPVQDPMVPIQSVAVSQSDAEVLFEYDGTLVDEMGKPNSIIVNRLLALSAHYRVGILSYRANDPSDPSLAKFITNYLSNSVNPIEATASISPRTKIIFSSRVVRVTKDGTDFCPMCLVSNDYTTYEANILNCMLSNIGRPQ